MSFHHVLLWWRLHSVQKYCQRIRTYSFLLLLQCSSIYSYGVYFLQRYTTGLRISFYRFLPWRCTYRNRLGKEKFQGKVSLREIYSSCLELEPTTCMQASINLQRSVFSRRQLNSWRRAPLSKDTIFGFAYRVQVLRPRIGWCTWMNEHHPFALWMMQFITSTWSFFSGVLYAMVLT